jgi:hypothetical protein
MLTGDVCNSVQFHGVVVGRFATSMRSKLRQQLAFSTDEIEPAGIGFGFGTVIPSLRPELPGHA